MRPSLGVTLLEDRLGDRARGRVVGVAPQELGGVGRGHRDVPGVEAGARRVAEGDRRRRQLIGQLVVVGGLAELALERELLGARERIGRAADVVGGGAARGERERGERERGERDRTSDSVAHGDILLRRRAAESTTAYSAGHDCDLDDKNRRGGPGLRSRRQKSSRRTRFASWTTKFAAIDRDGGSRRARSRGFPGRRAAAFRDRRSGPRSRSARQKSSRRTSFAISTTQDIEMDQLHLLQRRTHPLIPTHPMIVVCLR